MKGEAKGGGGAGGGGGGGETRLYSNRTIRDAKRHRMLSNVLIHLSQVTRAFV